MDILGSILNSMDKPPSVSSKQKEIMKKQREAALAKQKEEKEKLKKFRTDAEGKLNKFLNDPGQTRLKFPPMDQVLRAIIHEIAEEAGMVGQAFGEEGVDRYVMVFKREYPPSEDELTALRRGHEWNPETAKMLQREREALKADEEAKTNKKEEKFVPNTNYREKYEHLIGLDSAIDAAKPTATNKQYGFVPSENKKDQRSIEQTLEDIKKKKRKLNHPEKSDS